MAEYQVSRGDNIVAIRNTQEWSQRSNESAPAYEAFRVYLNVQDEKAGGIRETARRLGKSPTMVTRWSSRNDWVNRARAWTNHQVILEENEMRKAMREESKTFAKRRVEAREIGFELGKMCIERAKNLLRLPVFDKVVKETKEIHGELVETVTILNFEQHPRDARLLVETGLKVMRLSLDMSTENVDLGLPDDVNLEELPDEELEAYIEKLTQMKKISTSGQ